MVKKSCIINDPLTGSQSGCNKIYLCAADSDMRISYNLATLLEEKGFEVFPSRSEMDKGTIKSKVKESSLDACDIVVIVHSWSSARSKKYIKEIDNVIKKAKPITSIFVKSEDYDAIDPLLIENEFAQDPNMSRKFENLLNDIDEFKEWFEYLKVEEEEYIVSDEENKTYEEAMEYWDNEGEKAFKILEAGALKGFAECQFLTGICYYRGIGVKVDKAKAREWQLKAAEQNYLRGLNVIGRNYMDGEQCEKNAELALKYLKKAAKMGLGCAAYNIGLMFDEGEIVEQNYGKALFWYILSSESEEIHEMYKKFVVLE